MFPLLSTFFTHLNYFLASNTPKLPWGKKSIHQLLVQGTSSSLLSPFPPILNHQRTNLAKKEASQRAEQDRRLSGPTQNFLSSAKEKTKDWQSSYISNFVL